MKRVRAFAHVNDPNRAATYTRLLADDAADVTHLSEVEQRLAHMLFFSLWPDGGGHASYADGFRSLRSEPAVREEISSIVDYVFDESRQVTVELGDDLADVPLRVHARYQREEVLAALGYAHLDRKPNSFREGVLYVPERNVDALFVTLRKSAADYSPTTMYRDYPIDQHLFHWESQSTTTLRSKTGQRYVLGSSTVLLFVREAADGPYGTEPYAFLGRARHVEHTGERPIAIVWRLDTQMPADFFSAASLIAS